MKILFVFTGGTIGSTYDGNYISTDNKKPYALIDAYTKAHNVDFDYDIVEPYTELSENNTGAHIKALIETVKANIDNYDGIIVTHGTDTLQYSAAALSYALGLSSKPIALVSSNFPLENPKANAIPNLFGAISAIKLGVKGTFVPYQNPGEEIVIHRGTRLLANDVFSDKFYSVMNRYYAVVKEDGSLVLNDVYKEHEDSLDAPTAEIGEQCTYVARVAPYPGMLYPEIPDCVKFVLIDSYHSGTINTKSEQAKAFFEKIKNKKVFLTGMLKKISYDSTKVYDSFGIIPIDKRITPISAYVKLWLYGDTLNPEEYLSSSRGGDIF